VTVFYERAPATPARWVPSVGSGTEGPARFQHPRARPDRPWRRRLLSEGTAVYVLSFGAFSTVAMLLDFKYFSFPGDAVSRMANGFYIFHSRDPHLAAVGFVWNPLSSIADLPLLLFNSVWPDLASHNVAGTMMSAVAMAGAVYQLHAILREWKVQPLPRLVMTALFAVNPMILLYGGNGMSEAGYLFTTIATTRYLLRWLRNNDLKSLAYAAIALGFGYLQRNECVGAAALAGPLVLWVAFIRSTGDRRTRTWAALTDFTIFVIPLVTTVVGWAVASYVITGQAFGQFTSQYGNSAQLANSHIASGHYAVRIAHEARDLAFIGPAIPVVVITALVVAVARRNLFQLLGIAAVLGGILGFSLGGYLDNSVFPWFRFYIAAIPIQVLLVGSLFAVPSPIRHKPTEGDASPRPAGSVSTRRAVVRTSTAILATLVAIVLLVPSVIGTGRGMLNPKVGIEESVDIGYIFNKHQSAQDVDYKGAYGRVVTISSYLDDMHLPVGDLIADTADSCVPSIVTNVDDPRMFVITNDRDFQRVLADPLTFHAHYYLVSISKGASADEVDVAYPTTSSRANWSHLIHTFQGRGACGGLYLYKVTGHPQGTF
jgi:hypothetical protein